CARYTTVPAWLYYFDYW
nr:immunoglobulin heavy chain junction region [Mus musculus]